MANKERGEYEILLDKPRTWKITQNEQCTIEGILAVRRGEKVSFDAFIAQLGTWTAEDYRLFLWAGLRREDKQLTEEQVGDMVFAERDMEFRTVAVCWIQDRLPESTKKKLDVQIARAKIPTVRAPVVNTPGATS